MKKSLTVIISVLIITVVFTSSAFTMGLSHSSSKFTMPRGSERDFHFTVFNTNNETETYSIEIENDDFGIASFGEKTFSVLANGKHSGIIYLQIPDDFELRGYQFRVIISTIINEERGAATVSTANLIDFDINISEEEAVSLGSEDGIIRMTNILVVLLIAIVIAAMVYLLRKKYS